MIKEYLNTPIGIPSTFKRLVKSRNRKQGLPPGALVHVGGDAQHDVSVSVIAYNKNEVEETKLNSLSELPSEFDPKKVYWINVDGVHDKTTLKTLGDRFGIHYLALEDIMNTDHRPKLEWYDNDLFMVLKMVYYPDSLELEDTPNTKKKNKIASKDIKEIVMGQPLISEQVSLYVKDNVVMTFQEDPDDIFMALRKRIRKGTGKVRTRKADYLLYALVDAVVDEYYMVLETLDSGVEAVENDIFTDNDTDTLMTIQFFKREILVVRKAVWPLRDVVDSLIKSDVGTFEAETLLYMRDVYDHLVQMADIADSFRDMARGLLDTSMSVQSHKMNEVMKVLTVISTVFIPITFIAGVYGMNFQNMPELAVKWAYPAVWGLMLSVGSGMILYFRRKNWF